MEETELKKKLKRKLEDIAEILIDSTDIFNSTGVLSGVSGLALFMYYYARFTDDAKYTEVGEQALEKAVDMINNGFSLHTFCSGISGLAWTCEHLEQNRFINRDTITFMNDLDIYLLKCMKKEFTNNHYDFLHGGLGVGYYFISKRPGNNRDNKTLYFWLKDSAITCADGSLKWESRLHNSDKTIINISLSHGISSIVAVLAKLCNLYPKSIEARNILFNTVKYILQQQLPVPKTSLFPSCSLEYDINPQSSRLSWCYGDLGIAQAILQAAKALGNKHIEDISLKILLYNCSRRKMLENGIMDAGICHGASGISHIFNRLYKNTKIEAFKKTSVYWMKKAIEMAHFSDGLAGFKTWRGDKGEWINELSLLEGISGIGLSILSQLNPDLMNWDECLLLS